MPATSWTTQSADYDRLVDGTVGSRLRLVLGFGWMIYLSFWLLDNQVYPERAVEFLQLRLIVAAALLAFLGYTWVPRPLCRFVWLIDAAIVLTTGSIALMIWRTDGVESPYYQGLSICLLALVTVNSFYARHNLAVGAWTLALYFAAVLANPAPVSSAAILPPVFFVGSTIFFCYVLTRLYGAQHREQHEKSVQLKLSARQVAEANQKLKANERLKDEFFANVSHELRTPLALILGPTRRLLTLASLDEAGRHDAAVVEKNAVTLLRQVNQLLDLSKLDAGKMEVVAAPLDLAQVVRFVSSHFEAKAAECGIDFAVETPSALPLVTDREKVERILFNLLANAFKFAPVGGRVKVVLETQGRSVGLIVEDNGPGVPPTMRREIFERFRQVDGGATRRYGGTGLGLAIAAEFARLVGGEIAVGDARPQGAVFTVTLPLVAPKDLAAGATVSGVSETGLSLADEARAERRLARKAAVRDQGEPPPAASAAKVLVVEDNEEMGQFIVESLAQVAQVRLAANGVEAFNHSQAEPPDLVVTDVMMPEMDGVELVSMLRSVPHLRDVPILVLTAKADDASKSRLLAEGVQDYLPKPFLVEELVARARNLLDMKRARDVLAREVSSGRADLTTMAEDLTSAKRTTADALATAEAAARAKDEFLMNLSHELRTPLTSIMGWSEFFRADGEDGGLVDAGELRDGMDAIHRNAVALLRLVNDLLDLSRVVQGKLCLELKPFKIAEALYPAIAAVDVTARAKDVSVAVPGEGDEACRAFVLGDPERLQQVVWNLLSNAVKFTPAGGYVSLRVERTPAEVVIRVVDSGRGISPEFLPHVFERMRQEDGSTKKSYAGLGIGLAIARHLVELHGGRITAESPGVGRGATFAVTLPLATGAALGGEQQQQMAETGELQLG